MRSVDGFECVVMHVKHTVRSCSLLFSKKENPSCFRCPVGKAHAAGDLPERWPEARGGGVIRRLPIVAYDGTTPRVRRPRGMNGPPA